MGKIISWELVPYYQYQKCMRERERERLMTIYVCNLNFRNLKTHCRFHVSTFVFTQISRSATLADESIHGTKNVTHAACNQCRQTKCNQCSIQYPVPTKLIFILYNYTETDIHHNGLSVPSVFNSFNDWKKMIHNIRSRPFSSKLIRLTQRQVQLLLQQRYMRKPMHLN